eukprot:scpid94651/ scgid13000/ 
MTSVHSLNIVVPSLFSYGEVDGRRTVLHGNLGGPITFGNSLEICNESCGGNALLASSDAIVQLFCVNPTFIWYDERYMLQCGLPSIATWSEPTAKRDAGRVMEFLSSSFLSPSRCSLLTAIIAECISLQTPPQPMNEGLKDVMYRSSVDPLYSTLPPYDVHDCMAFIDIVSNIVSAVNELMRRDDVDVLCAILILFYRSFSILCCPQTLRRLSCVVCGIIDNIK